MSSFYKILCLKWYINVGLSENSVPLHPMVLLIIIPTKWLAIIGGLDPIFRSIPMWFLVFLRNREIAGIWDSEEEALVLPPSWARLPCGPCERTGADWHWLSWRAWPKWYRNDGPGACPKFIQIPRFSTLFHQIPRFSTIFQLHFSWSLQQCQVILHPNPWSSNVWRIPSVSEPPVGKTPIGDAWKNSRSHQVAERVNSTVKRMDFIVLWMDQSKHL